MPIHEFWIELCPQFQNGFEFVYYFLDVITILYILRIFSNAIDKFWRF